MPGRQSHLLWLVKQRKTIMRKIAFTTLAAIGAIALPTAAQAQNEATEG